MKVAQNSLSTFNKINGGVWKVKHFLWRALQDLIAMDANLFKHHVPNNGFCCWCRNGWGSSFHCPIFCDKIKEAWKEWVVVKGMVSWSLSDICKHLFFKGEVEFLERWAMGLWSVWRFLHGEPTGNVCVLMSGSDLLLHSFYEARRQGLCVWTPPRQGSFRLDVDVSTHFEGRSVGLGFAVRNYEGRLVAAGARKIGD